MAKKRGDKFWKTPSGSRLYKTVLKEGLAQPAKVSVHSRVLAAEQKKREKAEKLSEAKKGEKKRSKEAKPMRIKLRFKTNDKAALKRKQTRLKEKAKMEKLKEKARLRKLKERERLKKQREQKAKKKRVLKEKQKAKAKVDPPAVVDNAVPEEAPVSVPAEVESNKKSARLERMLHRSKVVASASRAKRILAKAKKSSASKLADVSRNRHAVKKQFVLPSQSARSSRKIIPNKRLLDYDEGFSPVRKRPKLEVYNQTPEAAPSENAEPQSSDVTQISPPAELPSPKRDRKPSAKMIEALCDEVRVARGHHGQSSKKKESGQLSVAAQLSGRSILHKAKFRLNQAALNRSKAALARSLQRQMKKEQSEWLVSLDCPSHFVAFASLAEKIDGEATDLPTSPVLPAAGIDSPAFGMSPLDLQRLTGSGSGNYGLAKAQRPAVFGQSSLPASESDSCALWLFPGRASLLLFFPVPKYALKSTTDALPTFEGACKQSTPKGKQCYVCNDSSQKHLHPFGSLQLVCRTCYRFFFKHSVALLQNRPLPTCAKDGRSVFKFLVRCRSQTFVPFSQGTAPSTLRTKAVLVSRVGIRKLWRSTPIRGPCQISSKQLEWRSV